jgi:hypothetical protein
LGTIGSVITGTGKVLGGDLLANVLYDQFKGGRSPDASARFGQLVQVTPGGIREEEAAYRRSEFLRNVLQPLIRLTGGDRLPDLGSPEERAARARAESIGAVQQQQEALQRRLLEERRVQGEIDRLLEQVRIQGKLRERGLMEAGATEREQLRGDADIISQTAKSGYDAGARLAEEAIQSIIGVKPVNIAEISQVQ